MNGGAPQPPGNGRRSARAEGMTARIDATNRVDVTPGKTGVQS